MEQQAFISTEVRYSIAAELGVPNEHIEVRKVHDSFIWFDIGRTQWNARTVRNGAALKKNSIRREW